MSACGDGPVEPIDGPLDTTQVRGTLLLSGDSVDTYASLTWIPGTDLVVYSSSPTGGDCAIKTVAVSDGTTSVVDDDCFDVPGSKYSYHRNIVAANDGMAIYYTVRVEDDIGGREQVLRSADPAGSDVTTIRRHVVLALALSRDGNQLAYLAGPASDSLMLRELATDVETELAYGGEFPLPILFSPNDMELLYQPLGELYRILLIDGTTVPATSPVFPPHALHWDESGLSVMVHQSGGFEVHNLMTGEVRSVSDEVQDSPWMRSAQTWSTSGDRVAYAAPFCLDEFLYPGGCRLERVALFTADPRTGSHTRVVFTVGVFGKAVFSPDGKRIVYNLDGDLYISHVP